MDIVILPADHAEFTTLVRDVYDAYHAFMRDHGCKPEVLLVGEKEANVIQTVTNQPRWVDRACEIMGRPVCRTWRTSAIYWQLDHD